MRLRSAVLLFLPLALSLALPVLASAQDGAAAQAGAAAQPKREKKTPAAPSSMERGSLATVDSSGLVVEFVSGKLTRYERTDKTLVRGQKQSWDELAPGDNVKVRIHGRVLHAVVVMPNAERSAEVEAQRKKAQGEYIKQRKAAAAKKKANPPKPKQPKN